MTNIILHVFQFPALFSLEEYVKLIQDWIFLANDEKMKLGFQLHDIDGDGLISPADVTDLQNRLTSESSYMHTFDITLMTNTIQKKVEKAPVQHPSEVAKNLLEEIEIKHAAKDSDDEKDSEEKALVTLKSKAARKVAPRNSIKFATGLAEKAVFHKMAQGMSQLQVNQGQSVYKTKFKKDRERAEEIVVAIAEQQLSLA